MIQLKHYGSSIKTVFAVSCKFMVLDNKYLKWKGKKRKINSYVHFKHTCILHSINQTWFK